ncbi:MAG TPA: hypothetical protein VG448_11170 [Solirubrobacterales bacterium]|nr:hypothetical protein [Solirubrobacterales bacterium]
MEGHGASGKTVLCTKIGLERICDLRPVYYIDLAAAHDDVSRIIDAMVTYGDEGILFIVDNIHLAEATAGEVFDNWQAREDGSQLLFSGREISGDPWNGAGDALHDIREQAVQVRPAAEEIFGTYRRLVARRFPNAQIPPRFLTRRWAALFRGDLVAFAVALGREHARGQPFGELSANDAVDYVRETYLSGYVGKSHALDALLAAAALSVLEIPAPISLVQPDLVEPSLDSGALLRVGNSITVAHPGLARLLLAAAEREEIDQDLLLRCASEQSSLASDIAIRLFRRHEIEAGEAIFRLMIDRGEWNALLPESLDEFLRLTHVIHGVMSWTEMDELVAEETSWAKVTPRTSLSRLVAILELCGGRMPRCSAALGEICFPRSRPAPWLLQRFSVVGPAARARFVRATQKFHKGVVWGEDDEEARVRWVDDFAVKVAARGLDRATWKEIKGACETSEVAVVLDRRLADLGTEGLIAMLSRMPAQRINGILKLDLPLLAASIESVLGDRRLARAWIANSLEVGGADDLTRRLFRARDSLPALHRAVGLELARTGDAVAWARELVGYPYESEEKNASRGLGRAMNISIASLEAAPFVKRADEAFGAPELQPSLRYAMRVQGAESLGRAVRVAPDSWPRLNARLIDFAGDPEVTVSLARELCNATLSELRLLLVDHPLSVAVLAQVVPGMWAVGRPVLESGSSYVHFPAVASGLSRLGFVELARPLANSLGEAILRGDVPTSRLFLTHVSHLLRLIPTDAVQLRDGLKSLFLADEWVGDALPRIGGFAAAQALYSLWGHAPDFAEAIPAEPLRNKLNDALGSESSAAAVALLGSTSLLLPDAIHKPPDWLDSATASSMLAWKRWQGPSLPPVAVQVLLGLRAAARAGACLELPSDQLAQISERCSATESHNRRLGDLVDGLGEWLKASVLRGDALISEG